MGPMVAHQLEDCHKILHHIDLVLHPFLWFPSLPFPRAGSPDQFVPGNRTLEDIQSFPMVLGKDHGGLAVQEGQQMLNQISGLPELPFCIFEWVFLTRL